MTTLTDKFDTLEGQLADENASVVARLTALEEALALVSTNLETLNSNGATNTRYLLGALAALDPCRDCGTPPSLEVPVPGVISSPIDEEKCGRAQGLLAAIRHLLAKIDLISNFGTGFNLTLVQAAISEVIADITSTTVLPAPSYVEISTLIGSGLAFLASNILRGDHLVDLFDAQSTNLLAALYGATTSAAAQAAYNSVIEASGLPADERGELEAVAFTSWFNAFYDPSSTVDTSAYDTDLCGAVDAGSCNTLTSSPDSVYDSGSFSTTREAIAWPAGYTRQTAQADGRYTHSNRVVLVGDFYHYTVLRVSGTSIRCFGEDSGGTVLFSGQPHLDYPAPYTIPNHTAQIVIDAYPGNDPFTIEFCPPAS